MAWATSRHPGSTSLQRRQRAEILQRDPLCYLQYAGCTGMATEEDHVTPLAQGGDRWSYSNRRGACHHCHAIKTARESAQARRTRGRRPDERHPGLRGG
jgi:5-methylcytosine-specific restriction endonuclease McrA